MVSTSKWDRDPGLWCTRRVVARPLLEERLVGQLRRRVLHDREPFRLSVRPFSAFGDGIGLSGRADFIVSWRRDGRLPSCWRCVAVSSPSADSRLDMTLPREEVFPSSACAGWKLNYRAIGEVSSSNAVSFSSAHDRLDVNP